MFKNTLYDLVKKRVAKNSKPTRLRIYGHPVVENQKATSFLKSVYGLNHLQASRYVLQFGRKLHSKCKALGPREWAAIKRKVERRPMLEKALRKHTLLSLRNKINQGNFFSHRFWRGLPIRGQNNRTNGLTARKINIARIPPNMRLKTAALPRVSTGGKKKQGPIPQQRGVGGKRK